MNLIKRLMTKFFYNASWLKIALILFVCWLPYCILHYPMRFGGGSQNMINMLYGIETLARNMSSTIYEGHYISNHHPVLLTLYYGLFFRLGDLIGHKNIAAFLLSLTNLLICGCCMGYAISTLRNYMGKLGFYICLLFVIINPIYGMYAYTCCKDNLFAAVMLLYTTLLFEIVITEGYILKIKSKYIIFLTSSLLIPFLKNQGIIVVLTSLLIGGVVLKRLRKQFVIIMVCIILIYPILFCNVLMPLLKIAPGGRQEALSVPFNQTAAYYKEYPEDITPEENLIVDKVLPTNELVELYEEDSADNVKFKFKQEATFEDLLNYFKVYIKQFYRHPRLYFKAWYNLTSGYYNILYVDKIGNLSGRVNCQGVKSPDWVLDILNYEKKINERLINNPFFRCLRSPALYSYMLFGTIICTIYYSIKQKRNRIVKNMWVVCVPLMVNFLVLLACPYNGIIRYALPLIWGWPIEFNIILFNHRMKTRGAFD